MSQVPTQPATAVGPARHRRPDRAERRRPADRRARDLRRAARDVAPPRPAGVRHRRRDHPVRVHRRGVHPVRDGRGERAARLDPGGPRAKADGRPGWSTARSGSRSRCRCRSRCSSSSARRWLAERFSGLPDVAAPAFRWAARGDPADRAGVHVPRRHARAEDHGLHADRPVGRPARGLDRAHGGVLGARGGDGRRRPRAAFGASWGVALGIGVGGLVVPAAPAAGARRRRGSPRSDRRAAAVRGAPRAGDAVQPAPVLHRLLRDLDPVRGRRRRSGRRRSVSTARCCAPSQALFLFLASVSLTFSPFVADLHHRGERDQLDRLYKQVTRWSLAATIPVLLVLDRAARAGAASVRQGLRRGRAGAAHRGARHDRAGDRGHRRVHLDHGRAHRLGSARLPGRVRDRRGDRPHARPARGARDPRGAAIAQACTLTFSALARLFLVQPVPGDLAVRRLVRRGSSRPRSSAPS